MHCVVLRVGQAMGQDASGEAVEEGWGAGSGGRAAGAMQDADEIFTLSYEEVG